ncbi:alpha/beta fold hydrolase [Streptomyces sp. PRKS01-65]|nr:alpha/beta fold hydrolase [Streptomyces harenosi]
MWEAQRRALSALGHTVLPLDQRGFGRAPLGPAAPSLDVLADDVARLLDHHGADRAVLAGCSMGGYTTLAFLRRHPDRVAGLALLSTRATADGPEARARRLRFARLVEDERTREAVVARSASALTGATTRRRRPRVLARVAADARAADPAALAWAQRAIADRPDALDALRATRVPAVVIAGAEDELVTLEESRRTAAALPNGRLVVIGDAGHLPPLETPDAVTRALRHLLGTPEGAPPCPR